MTKGLTIIIVIALLALLSLGVVAQSYSIRVNVNANIRAQPSLDGAWIETAPAGTILEVTSEFNRWLRINRGGEAWMASWVSHERIETPASQPAAAVGVNIDNCCQVDRQCHSDLDWIGGWHAYQNGECQAPSGSTQASAPQPAASSQVSDNCCGIDRQCASDQDWINGYHAYQNGQCGALASGGYAAPVSIPAGAGNCCQVGWACGAEHEWIFGQWAFQHNRCSPSKRLPPFPPAGPYSHHGHIRIIELSAGFTDYVNRGFELLRAHVPHYYRYVVNAISEVRECHNCGSGVEGATGKTSFHHGPFSPAKPLKDPQDIYTMAEFLVHEACHVYQYHEGRGVGGDNGWLNEYECQLFTLDFMNLIGGRSWNIDGLREFLNDPMNRALWWW